jgi:hypothetical protein
MSAFGQFGIRHEIAKRWTPFDLFKSNQVKKKIDQLGADLEISRVINLGKPALIGRLGGTEARFLGEYLKISRIKYLQKFLSKTKPNWIKRSREITTNAGFYFKNLDQVSDFFNLYDEALLDTDVMGAWGTAFAWIEANYVNSINKLIPVPMTAPWVDPYLVNGAEKPWADALAGKTVLVISPFADSISKQHKIISKVFPDHFYPQFILKTIKAPQTIGFNSSAKPSWFENLSQVKSQMSSENFDIALVAAGAYSYPLAHHAKKLGKIGIHAGGSLQLFFGIIGKRWEVNWGKGNYLEKYFNEFWTRPAANETPDNAHKVEDGCYW